MPHTTSSQQLSGVINACSCQVQPVGAIIGLRGCHPRSPRPKRCVTTGAAAPTRTSDASELCHRTTDVAHLRPSDEAEGFFCCINLGPLLLQVASGTAPAVSRFLLAWAWAKSAGLGTSP